MKKLLYLLLSLTLLSCKPKSNEPTKTKSAAELRSEYLQTALKSDEYKNASMNVQRVKDFLDSVKKGKMDSNAVIFVYNNSIATATEQANNLSQVKKGMKKDTDYLKAVQSKVATDLASSDSANMKSKAKK